MPRRARIGARRRLAARWLANAITLCDGCRLNFVTVTGQILMAVHRADASHRTTGRCTAQGDIGYALLCGKIA
jgi:hypothetical protein